MKILFFALLVMILIGATSYSYAQIALKIPDDWVVPDKDNKIEHDVMLQLELRDSDGALVAYIETDQVLGISPPQLNRFLDSQDQSRKDFFVKNDTKYETQRWEITGDKYNDKLAYSLTRLIDPYQDRLLTLVQMRHDSFQTNPGDTVRIYWTVIRPAS